MQEEPSIFGPEFDELDLPRRRALLPWWVKVFSWLFIILGAIAAGVFLLSLMGFSANIALYGLEATRLFSVEGIILISVFLLKAVTGAALWTEQQWAITTGIADAVIGIVFCVFMMGIYPFITAEREFNLRLELILLIPYLRWLIKVKPAWEKKR